MSKQERLILAAAAVILLIGVFVIFRGTTPPSNSPTLEPIPAPVAGEPSAPPVEEVADTGQGEGINVRSYKGRILPLCGLHGDIRIYYKPNDRTDSGDKLLDCRNLSGNLEDFGWPSFLIKEEGEWLAIEQQTDMRGINIQGPVEVRFVRRDEIGTPSMLIDGDKLWPLELAWANIAAKGSQGILNGYDGWCYHRDQPVVLRNLPKIFSIQTFVRQRSEDDCST